MPKRVEGKAAIVVGGGQTPGQTVGNGRATAIVLGREGARVCVVDRALASAQETADLIKKEGGEAWAFAADVTREDDVKRLIAAALERFGRIDILHNNVGASLALGDAVATDLTEEAFDRSVAVNLKATWLTCKHALPALRESHGSIVNIASMAALNAYPLVGYKTTKAAVVALTENLAAHNAQVRRPRQLDPARADEHADGDRVAGGGGHAARGGHRLARPAGPARPAHGHRLGRGPRGAVPALRGGRLHHRGLADRGRRRERELGLLMAAPALPENAYRARAERGEMQIGTWITMIRTPSAS